MKSIIKTITVKSKNVMMALVLLTISMVSSVQARATDKSKSAEPLPIEVKSLGSLHAQPLIQLSIPNLNGEEGKIMLIDENGNVIFTDSFQGKPYSKKFQINADADVDNLMMKVIVTSKNETNAQVYQITNASRTIQEVTVSPVTN
jgi:hypothetical protein